jgi:hypothetical protein
MFGSLTGSMLPFILQRIGFDPASASAPFVATLFPRDKVGQFDTELVGRVGAQHTLNAEYFKRIDALRGSVISDERLVVNSTSRD